MPKLLQVALERQNHRLAAYAIVYGLVKTKIADQEAQNEKKGRPARQSKRS